jgi:hypothetical protein
MYSDLLNYDIYLCVGDGYNTFNCKKFNTYSEAYYNSELYHENMLMITTIPVLLYTPNFIVSTILKKKLSKMFIKTNIVK